MIVAFDANMLSLLLHQTARIPVVPNTTIPISKPRERIDFLITTLTKAKATIIIPTPALAEFLVVVAEVGPRYVSELQKRARFEIAPFDEKAAIEAAAFIAKAIRDGDKRAGSGATWQKAKVDQQIVAIAKTANADALYSTDPQLLTTCSAWGVRGVALWDLPLPADENFLPWGVDNESSATSGASSAPVRPAPQSAAAAPETTAPSGQGRPSNHQAVPTPPPPDSSE